MRRDRARARKGNARQPLLARLRDQGRHRQVPRSHPARATRADLDFLEDARIPLDNNATERGIRGPVVGRKNHYGSKSKRGTEVAALFYSLLETAKLCGVDPAHYLRQAALADARGEVLLPHQLAEAAPA